MSKIPPREQQYYASPEDRLNALYPDPVSMMHTKIKANFDVITHLNEEIRNTEERLAELKAERERIISNNALLGEAVQKILPNQNLAQEVDTRPAVPRSAS